MNIDLSAINSSRGIAPASIGERGEAVEQVAAREVKPLMGDALKIEEKEMFSLNKLEAMDIDDIEAEITRDDALGQLMSSHLNWDPPEMPRFV